MYIVKGRTYPDLSLRAHHATVCFGTIAVGTPEIQVFSFADFQFLLPLPPLLAFSVAHRQAKPAEFGFSSAEFSCTVLICIEFVGRVCAISKRRFGIGSADELGRGKSVSILQVTRPVGCTVNPQVPGSSPGRGAKRILHLATILGGFLLFKGSKSRKSAGRYWNFAVGLHCSA